MDRQLQDKLQQFSATPPDGVWNKISDALDAEENFSQRLYQYKEIPPDAAWQKIEKKLDETVPAKVIPIQKHFHQPMRYAAIAVFLATVLVAVTVLLRKTDAGTLDPAGNSSVLTTQPSTVGPLIEQTAETSKTKAAKNSDPQISNAGLPKKEPHVTASIEHKQTKKRSPVYSSLNEYVFFSDGDGQVRKVSRKLVEFVNCKDNDLPCKQRLRELRQQMAAKAMTTDFTGVVELLRQIQ